MKKTSLIIILMFLMVLTACSGKSVPKTGEYITDDRMSQVFLEKDGNFIVIVAGRSYAPNGEYRLNDKLILTIDNDNILTFSFKNDTLIFESGEWLESVIEKGTEFHLVTTHGIVTGDTKMWLLTSKWIAVPEIPYIAMCVLGAVLTVLAIVKLVLAIRKKKSRSYIAIWGVVLAVGVIILFLVFTHILIANTMIGG